MKHWFLLLVAVLVASIAVYGTPDSYDRNVLSVNLSTRVDVVSTGSDYSADYLKVNISFKPSYPGYQQALDIRSSPESTENENGFYFVWTNPQPGVRDARIMSVIEVSKWQPMVRQKVAFPVKGLDKQLEAYTLPSPMIDSDDPGIIALASELAEGEDDLYNVVFRFGNWTKQNIEYNLSTLTAEVSLNASWVLKNRQGVCDELSSLFIAMLRSVGVPARFVTGEAYTNSPLFEEGWGGHGWAEVYFPGYGWVPFDVTYGQFGYVDSAHMKIMDSLGPADDSVVYSWKGRDMDVESGKLSIDTGLVYSGNDVAPQVRLSAKMIEENVGFGSYNLAEVSIQNLNDYYVAVDVYAGRTEGLNVDASSRSVLLGPKEEKAEYFLVKLDGILSKGFIYTFPLSFYATDNVSASTAFSAASGSRFFDIDYFNRFYAASPIGKSFSPALNLSCSPEKNNYYSYEFAVINCTAKNIGNSRLESVNACFDKKCHSFSMGISQGISFSFGVNLSKSGFKEGKNPVYISANNNDVGSYSSVIINVMDIPVLNLVNVSYPETVSFGKPFNVSFTVLKKSVSSAGGLVIGLGGKDIFIGKLEESRMFVLPVDSAMLNAGNNTFELVLQYEDGNGRLYSEKSLMMVSVEKPAFLQRIIMFLRRLFGLSE